MQNSLLHYYELQSTESLSALTNLFLYRTEPFCVKLIIFAILLQVQQGFVDFLGQRAVFLQGQAVGLSFHGVAYDLGIVFAAAGSQEVFRYGLIDDNRFHALVL